MSLKSRNDTKKHFSQKSLYGHLVVEYKVKANNNASANKFFAGQTSPIRFYQCDSVGQITQTRGSSGKLYLVIKVCRLR